MTEQKELKVEDIKKAADEKGCAVQKAIYYVTEFLSGPMCGRCFPCSMGSYEARIILQNLAEGRGTGESVSNLKRIATLMLDSSMCKKGKDTAKFILEWMDTDVFSKHSEGICPEKTCRELIEYRIIPDKCNLCGICKDVCKYGAIHGEKKKPYLSGYRPYEIRQKKCTKCGDCIKVCPTEAIILVDAKVKEPVGV
jgi:NAD-dependent dihydropyrimidine dehydrogenase PreA subunit